MLPRLPVPLREQGLSHNAVMDCQDGMRTRSGSALLGVVIGAGPAADPLMTGEPGGAGMLWLWALVADGDWSADEGQGRS